MRLTDLNFTLPPELIAQNPAEPRDSARLLVYRRSDKSVTHATVRELPTFLPSRTLLVANNSRVRQARLNVRRANGRQAELLVLKPYGAYYECMLRGKGVQAGEPLTLDTGQVATVVAPHQEAGFTTYLVDFQASDVEELLEQVGTVLLPPYITQSEAPAARYQTIYADPLGSAAAPTAGLHFTPELLEWLRRAGNGWETVTLHVGMGTFQPLRHEQVLENRLHQEQTTVTPEAAARITAALQEQQTVLAVGTTACRTLESHANGGHLTPGTQNTELFIYPGYTFQATRALFTNFHLPKRPCYSSWQPS